MPFVRLTALITKNHRIPGNLVVIEIICSLPPSLMILFLGDSAVQDVQESMGACSLPQNQFNQCLSANPTNIAACQWAFDEIQKCFSDPRSFNNAMQ